MKSTFNTLTMLGGSIKSLGISDIKGRRVGRLGGTLCLHSTANDPDATKARDFFDASTDFKMTDGMIVPVYFHHGLHQRIGVKQIGEGRIFRDANGVQIEAEIWLDDPDGMKSYNDACAGKLGWSSGTAAHLVQRTAVKTDAGTSHHIDHWPMGLDASLTPTPAEPRNKAMEIKSSIAIPANPDDWTPEDWTRWMANSNETLQDLADRLNAANMNSKSKSYDFASTQCNLSEAAADIVRSWAAARIPDEVLADNGRDKEPHITVLYGLHEDAIEPVQYLADGFGEIKATVGDIDVFGARDYDVVILRIESKDLHRLHGRLSTLPHTSTFPTYEPHITLAYVKSGEGAQFKGSGPLTGEVLTFDGFSLSDKSGARTRIEIKADIDGMKRGKLPKKGAGHWITHAGHHVFIPDRQVNEDHVFAAGVAHDLGEEAHKVLDQAHKDGEIQNAAHLHLSLAHANRLKEKGVDEVQALKKGIERHGYNGNASHAQKYRNAVESAQLAELIRANVEARQARRDKIETFRASGEDIVDYVSRHADTIEEHHRMAKELGFNSTTWDDQRNNARREKERKRRRADSALRDRIALAKMVDEIEFDIADGIKAYDPNQSRDERGRWSGGATHIGLLQHTNEHVKPKAWHERTPDESHAMFERAFASAGIEVSTRQMLDNSREHSVTIQHPKVDRAFYETVREPRGVQYNQEQIRQVAIANLASREHQAHVERAASQGKAIPEHILDHYPHLHPDNGGQAQVLADPRKPHEKPKSEYVIDKQRSPLGRLDALHFGEGYRNPRRQPPSHTTQDVYEREHSKFVQAAVERGDYVPREVLHDYPELAKTVAQRYVNADGMTPAEVPPAPKPTLEIIPSTRQQMTSLKMNMLRRDLMRAQLDLLRI